MKKTLLVLVVVCLFLGGLGFLFTRWWRAHTLLVKMPVPFPSFSPSASPVVTSAMRKLMDRLAPLSDNETELPLTPGNKASDLSGFVRFTREGKEVQFTVYTLLSMASNTPHVYIEMGGVREDLGTLREGKAGWFLEGSVPKEQLPIKLIVGDALLEGEIPR